MYLLVVDKAIYHLAKGVCRKKYGATEHGDTMVEVQGGCGAYTGAALLTVSGKLSYQIAIHQHDVSPC